MRGRANNCLQCFKVIGAWRRKEKPLLWSEEVHLCLVNSGITGLPLVCTKHELGCAALGLQAVREGLLEKPHLVLVATALQ